MAKKYQPSGYYIINLDLSDKTSGTPFTPETEDEKLLLGVLSISDDQPKKPFCLHLIAPTGTVISGFVTNIDNALQIRDFISENTITIYVSSNKLVIEETGA